MEDEKISEFKNELIFNFQNLSEKLKILNKILKLKMQELEEMEKNEEKENITLDKCS
jgi:hypothetical protein